MKKIRVVSILLVLCLFFCGYTYPETYAGINTAPDVSAEMLQADYWINRTPNANQVLMTPEEIAVFNAQIMQQMAEKGEPMFNLGQVAAGYTVEKKAKLLSNMHAPSGTYYQNGKAVEKHFWDKIEVNMNSGAVPTANVGLGICVRRSDLRLYPTDELLNDSPGDLETDAMQNSGILMNEPFIILHSSLDGKWFYGMTYFASGWIKAEDIAFCDSVELWLAAQNFTDFLVVTGDKISLETDPVQVHVSGLEIPMGTKLQIVPEELRSDVIGGRTVYDNYVVQIPIRGIDGKLTYEYTLVPPSRDVNRGYLPYTSANVIEQSFKALGNRYGWGGMKNARDCSEYTLEVYRCFGFSLPRNSTTQSRIPCKSITWEEDVSDAQRLADLKNVMPGAILRFPGHIMIYLGQVNGEAYCISALGSFVPEDDGVVISSKTVMVNTLSVKRRSGKTWLQCITDVKMLVPRK